MDRLEQLKAKYQSVLGLMHQPGVRLQNVHLENNKLLIRAAAGSQEDQEQDLGCDLEDRSRLQRPDVRHHD
jgi:hypothetical protein